MNTDAERVQELALEWWSPSEDQAAQLDFASWLHARLNTDEGAEVARKLLRVEKLGIRSPKQPFSLLVYRLMRACHAASQSGIRTDKGAQYRQSLASLRSQRARIQKRSRKLSEMIAQYPALQWAFPIQFTVRKIDGPQSQNPQQNLVELLKQIADNLEKQKLPEMDGGPFFHRFTYGCLHFDQPLSGKKPPTEATALLFNLVLLLRKWTASGSCITQTAEKMPEKGRPCYSVAAALVAVTLREEMPDRKAQRLLASLFETHGEQGIGLVSWDYAVNTQPQNER